MERYPQDVIRQSATKRGLKKRKAVDACADYLVENGKWMQYGEALAAGLPIATGVIEGACKHLVKARMDLGGAKWHLVGAEVVLCLRSLLLSGDWDDYRAFHRGKEMDRVDAQRYKGGVPDPLPALAGRREGAGRGAGAGRRASSRRSSKTRRWPS